MNCENLKIVVQTLRPVEPEQTNKREAIGHGLAGIRIDSEYMCDPEIFMRYHIVLVPCLCDD